MFKEWEQRLKMQRWLVPSISIGVGVWLTFAGVVILAGVDVLNYHSSVLAALLGSSTASMVGLLMKVVTYTLPEMNW